MSQPHYKRIHVRSAGSPTENGKVALLGICTSLKPAPGIEGRSASRSLLEYSLSTVSNICPDVYSLDLRNHRLPLFDGRMPSEHDNDEVSFVSSWVRQAGALLLVVPAYWCGVSGVFKNFVDVLCGAAYDIKGEIATIFTGKPLGMVIVGADEQSAEAGSDQAQKIMASTGAMLLSSPVVVANPRTATTDAESLSRDLFLLSAELVRRGYVVQGKEV